MSGYDESNNCRIATACYWHYAVVSTVNPATDRFDQWSLHIYRRQYLRSRQDMDPIQVFTFSKHLFFFFILCYCM